MALIHTLKRHPVPAYFVLVYALSWACWIPLAIAKTWASFPFIVFAVAGNGMPSLLGILLTALLSGKTGLAELFGRLGRARAPLIWRRSGLPVGRDVVQALGLAWSREGQPATSRVVGRWVKNEALAHISGWSRPGARPRGTRPAPGAGYDQLTGRGSRADPRSKSYLHVMCARASFHVPTTRDWAQFASGWPSRGRVTK